VATSLETRVRNLETSTSLGGRNCPECGWDGITPLRPSCFLNYEEGPGKDRYCGTCGRPIHIIIRWEDAPD
jgi:hypothetical protein